MVETVRIEKCPYCRKKIRVTTIIEVHGNE